mmetsp:Transcript_17903/g.34066  ORF Transcript_17903/g.34066 Transcript_17903/m.34066 type:complete len:461 (-) Transcript_17903:59-1441(-)
MTSDAACSAPLGSWCLGIPITLHYTFFLLFALQVLNAIRQYDSFWYTLLIGVLYGPVLLITIVFHELGHAWMNKRFGGHAERIVLWPLGGYVLLGRTEGLSVMEDFWVALAGPLTHIPMAAIWFGIYLIFERYDNYEFDADASWDFDALNEYDGFLSTLAEQAMFLNTGLFVFNVFVPAYPLDGGRILAALLVLCCCSVACAAYLTSTVALLLAACMVAYGVYDLFIDDDNNNNNNADGGAPVLLILIGVWIALNSFTLLRCAMAGKATDHALFAKECYRRRAGVEEPASSRNNNNNNSMTMGSPNNGSDNFRTTPPPPAASSSSLEVPPSRRELRQQKKEEKKQAREEKKQAKRMQSGGEPDEGESSSPSSGFGKPPPTSMSQDFEPPPPPSDPVLSPAGGGTSWTTFHTSSSAPEPPPTFGESSDTSKHRGGGFAKLFGKRIVHHNRRWRMTLLCSTR